MYCIFPSIVLSAVSGLRIKFPELHESKMLVSIATSHKDYTYIINRLKYMDSSCLSYRLHRPHCLCRFSWPFCIATLWNTPCRVPVCSNFACLARLHWWYWHLQHLQVEPDCRPCSVPVLHIQLLQEDRQGWLELTWRDCSLHHRSVFFLFFVKYYSL
jgi:hypothetical protein